MYLTKTCLIFLVILPQTLYAAANTTIQEIQDSIIIIISLCQMEDAFINHIRKSLADQQVELNDCQDTLQLCSLQTQTDTSYIKSPPSGSLKGLANTCDRKSIYDTLIKQQASVMKDLITCREKAKSCLAYPPERIDENYYYLSKFPASGFDNAMKYCRGIGGYLAEFDSFAEMRIAQDYLKSLNNFVVFIGGSDSSNEGEWIFTRTGKEMEVFDWNTGEPNNLAFAENCLVLWTFSGAKMNDVPCDLWSPDYAFLCEVP